VEEQRKEFESYEYRLTPAGRMQFEAATGHDDEVAAKMLENWAVHHEAPPVVRTMDAHDLANVEQTTVPDEPLVPDSPAEIMARPGAWSS
jgi:hypothetical protein